ncbi:MAG: WD40 domain-containing protein [Planctomycetaceae bacterium]|jgi:WD40 repeat protein|nr:WD40 domain-containing protein [Planctomycetaceae bacterium]
MLYIDLVKILDSHTDLVESLVLSRKHGVLMSAGRDGKLLLWDTVGLACKPFFSWAPYNGIELYHSDVSNDLRFVLCCFSQYKEAMVYDRTLQHKFCVPLLEHCQLPCFASDNNSIVSHNNKIVYRIDLCNHGGIKRIFKVDSNINFFHWFKKRDCILLSTTKGYVYIIDSQVGSPRAILPKYYRKIAFICTAIDDSFIVIGDRKERQIDIWKIDNSSDKTDIELICVHSLNQHWLDDTKKFQKFNDGFICFINYDHAFVSGVTHPLCYIDFANQVSESLDRIGYCDSIVIDNHNNIIYAPLLSSDAKPEHLGELGQLGVYSYKIKP